jgi:D-serine dehydratase
MTAGVACGSCGTGLRENAKFCGECGAPTGVSGDTAEYKQVTVLFADVVHSMDIAAALDMGRFAPLPAHKYVADNLVDYDGLHEARLDAINRTNVLSLFSRLARND